VIYVKAGQYEESVRISSKQRDVMLMDDGKGKTVIVGHKSAAEGYTTYDSATVGTLVLRATNLPLACVVLHVGTKN
jgi:pectin methylesterase-like acyl-CoA thioesterase